MKKTFIAVRDVDEETFRKFKSLTSEERMKLGVALTIAMQDWIESKDTSETQKMVKMMQTYNVDNRRRDPIVLSNRGGRQR